MDRFAALTARLGTLAVLAGALGGMAEGLETWAEWIAGVGIAGLICVPVVDLLALRETFRRRGERRYADLTTLLLAVLAVAAATSVVRHV
ncbi:MAG: hypothetical protein QN188_09290 [Armatimonadota bacterium]|nr:hypothetical protein [Armatimonadota bacterium]MDR7387600.1 hypothetical protein [Armatimonadota bacterium]MDR7390354.1 hypothetical protein [Armatimonadota bacterium]MDR7395159.1 hypothetical protein [Armatimonadota bacterium]MDR7397617.1 hypothetical protein [Armatimonadota bacterium]